MLPLYFSSFLHLWMVSICFNQVFFCLRLCCWAAGRSMFVPRYEGAADTANNLWTGLSGVFQEVASRGFFFGVPLRSNGYRAYHSHRIHGAAIYMVTLIFTINIPPNVSIYTIHGSYGYIIIIMFPSKLPFWTILIHLKRCVSFSDQARLVMATPPRVPQCMRLGSAPAVIGLGQRCAAPRPSTAGDSLGDKARSLRGGYNLWLFSYISDLQRPPSYQIFLLCWFPFLRTTEMKMEITLVRDRA